MVNKSNAVACPCHNITKCLVEGGSPIVVKVAIFLFFFTRKSMYLNAKCGR